MCISDITVFKTPQSPNGCNALLHSACTMIKLDVLQLWTCALQLSSTLYLFSAGGSNQNITVLCCAPLLAAWLIRCKPSASSPASAPWVVPAGTRHHFQHATSQLQKGCPFTSEARPPVSVIDNMPTSLHAPCDTIDASMSRAAACIAVTFQLHSTCVGYLPIPAISIPAIISTASRRAIKPSMPPSPPASFHAGHVRPLTHHLQHTESNKPCCCCQGNMRHKW